MKCAYCGKDISHYKNNYNPPMCQGCYCYFIKNKGIVHPLPPKGELRRDDQGRCICHICGKAYRKLGGHIKENHNMTVREYQEQFGLCFKGMQSPELYKITRDNAISNNMPKQLQKVGVKSRFVKGQINTSTKRVCEERKQILLIKCFHKGNKDYFQTKT